MSLYGTGRGDGVVAASAAGAAAAVTHVAAGWPLDGGAPGGPDWTTATAGAVGATLAYRFLRAQGRSRYAAAMCSAAYGMSPLFAGLQAAPREQLAAALAPLALEAVAQLQRPDRRRQWLPWFGACFAAPFAFGATVVGALAAALGLCMLTVSALRDRRPRDGRAVAATALSLLGGCAAAASLVALAPLDRVLGPARAPAIAEVLAGEAAPMVIVRVIGPFLVWFALFGVLRRQRHVNTTTWTLLALVGAAPTVWAALPGAVSGAPDARSVWAVPAAAWWLSVLAITVMGAAGLDDWLDQPVRRRGAHLLLLATTLVVAPALPLAGETLEPAHVATVLGTFAALAAVTLAWRRLGVPRFKLALATVGLTAFALPVLWRRPPAGTAAMAAAPLAEGAATSWSGAWETLARAPWASYAGLGAALLLGGFATALLQRRRR